MFRIAKHAPDIQDRILLSLLRSKPGRVEKTRCLETAPIRQALPKPFRSLRGRRPRGLVAPREAWRPDHGGFACQARVGICGGLVALALLLFELQPPAGGRGGSPGGGGWPWLARAGTPGSAAPDGPGAAPGAGGAWPAGALVRVGSRHGACMRGNGASVTVDGGQPGPRPGAVRRWCLWTSPAAQQTHRSPVGNRRTVYR